MEGKETVNEGVVDLLSISLDDIQRRPEHIQLSLGATTQKNKFIYYCMCELVATPHCRQILCQQAS
jgi:hypothetical protein